MGEHLEHLTKTFAALKQHLHQPLRIIWEDTHNRCSILLVCSEQNTCKLAALEKHSHNIEISKKIKLMLEYRL
jgi:hypothetical protein